MTPFSLKTVDGETLYAWHILPLRTYLKHEEALQSDPAALASDITKTKSFDILRDDPNARVVISCKPSYLCTPIILA